MKFVLEDQYGEQVHTFEQPRFRAPFAVIWTDRAFIFVRRVEEGGSTAEPTVHYREGVGDHGVLRIE